MLLFHHTIYSLNSVSQKFNCCFFFQRLVATWIIAICDYFLCSDKKKIKTVCLSFTFRFGSRTEEQNGGSKRRTSSGCLTCSATASSHFPSCLTPCPTVLPPSRPSVHPCFHGYPDFQSAFLRCSRCLLFYRTWDHRTKVNNTN